MRTRPRARRADLARPTLRAALAAPRTMKDWIYLPIAAVVAGLVGFATAALFAPERAARGSDAGQSASELTTAVSELRAEQAKLAERLAALPSSAPAPGEHRVPAQSLDEAIAQYMARQEAANAEP